MPGPYAHITLLHKLNKPARLESIFTPASGYAQIIRDHFNYCCMGAVSPDYPNLARRDEHAFRWADAMHCSHACRMITSGIRQLEPDDGAARNKQVAWLLGYCAHVATDVTIHPVVQAKVGPYAGNQRQHRICEMNQDSYIFRRMNRGEIGQSNAFAETIATCTNSVDGDDMDRDIARLWMGMFRDVHPELYALHTPNVDLWQNEFNGMVRRAKSNTVRLFPLAGVISNKLSLAYPQFRDIDDQYIEEQLIPAEPPIHRHYDQLFDRAINNVATLWGQVEQSISNNVPLKLSNWNLDNGLNEDNKLVFW